MGPGLAETFDTPDILAEEGIEHYKRLRDLADEAGALANSKNALD